MHDTGETNRSTPMLQELVNRRSIQSKTHQKKAPKDYHDEAAPGSKMFQSHYAFKYLSTFYAKVAPALHDYSIKFQKHDKFPMFASRGCYFIR